MKTKKILILFITALMIFSASSCGDKGSDNEGYTGSWYYDSEYHWRDPDENGDDWKAKHNFVNDVCNLCGYSRKTGTVDPNKKPSGGSEVTPDDDEPQPDLDDSKPSSDEFGIGETVVGDDGYAYTVVYGNDEKATYSIGVGNHTGLTSLDIPETFNGVAVTAISDYGFRNEKSLKTVHIPNSIMAIGYEAFAHCTAISEIVIPDSVTFMDHRAFIECTSLKNLTLSKGLKNLYARTFYRCAFEEVRFPEGLEYIAKSCFSQCLNLKTLYVSSTVKTLDGESFFRCPVTKIVAHNLETWMGIDFSGSPMTRGGKLYFDETGEEELVTEVEIPEDTTEVKPHIFLNCSCIKKMIVPDSVTKIGIRAFVGCSGLEEIRANGVKEIIDQTFQNMTGLKKIYLLGAEKIDREVFWGSFNLKEIHFGPSLKDIGHRGLANCGVTDIYFEGTQAQWKSIPKYGYVDGERSKIVTEGDCWNYNLGEYIVHCSDGAIAEHGAVYDG